MINKIKMIEELKELFEDIEGPVRLHWEGDISEPEYFKNLEDCLSEVADQALKGEYTAEEIERIAYIVSESDHQEEVIDQRKWRYND